MRHATMQMVTIFGRWRSESSFRLCFHPGEAYVCRRRVVGLQCPPTVSVLVSAMVRPRIATIAGRPSLDRCDRDSGARRGLWVALGRNGALHIHSAPTNMCDVTPAAVSPSLGWLCSRRGLALRRGARVGAPVSADCEHVRARAMIRACIANCREAHVCTFHRCTCRVSVQTAVVREQRQRSWTIRCVVGGPADKRPLRTAPRCSLRVTVFPGVFLILLRRPCAHEGAMSCSSCMTPEAQGSAAVVNEPILVMGEKVTQPPADIALPASALPAPTDTADLRNNRADATRYCQPTTSQHMCWLCCRRFLFAQRARWCRTCRESFGTFALEVAVRRAHHCSTSTAMKTEPARSSSARVPMPLLSRRRLGRCTALQLPVCAGDPSVLARFLFFRECCVSQSLAARPMQQQRCGCAKR